MTGLSQEALGRVIGTLIKEERQRTDSRLNELSEETLLKGLLSSLLEANLRAIQLHCEHITLKRSVVVAEGQGGVTRAIKAVTGDVE